MTKFIHSFRTGLSSGHSSGFSIRPAAAAASVALVALLSGCVNLAPDWQEPALPVAAAWPQDSATENARLLTEGLAAWSDFFTDERLKTLIAAGIAQNRDLRTALHNVERARALYRVSRADLLPSVSAVAEETAGRQLATTTGRLVTSHQYTATAMAAYELDLFGRVKNLSEAALQTYFQTEAAQRSAQMTVVTEIAQTWLSLGAAKSHLELAGRTLANRRESLALIEKSYRLGAADRLDVREAEQTVASAKAAKVRAERSVSQYRNALVLLVGGEVDPKLEPAGLDDIARASTQTVSVPSSIPSEVLLNRPDLREAEAKLRAANADIGVARAAFFPSITLTAGIGTGSAALSDLLGDGHRLWNWNPGINIPIFTGGANTANLEAAEAAYRAALSDYEATVQRAFREFADALATEGTVERELAAELELAAAAEDGLRLAKTRYEKGADTFLNVLVSERTDFSAKEAVIDAKLARAASLVSLWKAMGGGSVIEAPQQTAAASVTTN